MTFPLWLADRPLVLASGSAVRRIMLVEAGIPVEVHPAAIDERAVEQPLRAAGASPAAIAIHLAEAKAAAVARDCPGRLVLGADQVLSLDGALFSKPPTLAAAREHLRRLSGRTHTLHAGACLAHNGAVLWRGCLDAQLTMRPLSDTFIGRYLAIEGEAVLASVGAYRLEGLGIQLFDAVEGDHRTILGLPLLAVLAVLRERGVLAG